MSSKKLIIHIQEIDNQKLIGFELKDITKDEAIVIFNRCLNRLLYDYDTDIKITKRI